MFDLTKYWYRKSLHPITFFLLPFSWIFYACVSIRRWLYDTGYLKKHRVATPVILVGNITIGGTGKTPFVIWLAQFLVSHGYRPGIVSRGVGGKKHWQPHWVKWDDPAEIVGDEAILLLQNTNCPVVIGIDRVAVVKEILRSSNCDIVIGDDGLQHYRLHRDIEIAMIDNERGFGNQQLLPAGPLREPIRRLQKTDFVIVNGDDANAEFSLMLEPEELVSLKNSERKIPLTEFPHKKIHAIAGIGHPERFFNLLKKNGFDLIIHAFPDHHLFQPQEIDFADHYPILMTEKDAVKCKRFASERCWYLPIAVKINQSFKQKLLKQIKGDAR